MIMINVKFIKVNLKLITDELFKNGQEIMKKNILEDEIYQ